MTANELRAREFRAGTEPRLPSATFDYAREHDLPSLERIREVVAANLQGRPSPAS